MTAQNMGKKILTDAGYEVVAVSNGAAAVKKIAEQKPDIIILDIYMPGYSGLEVCDKVRASVETLKTPVLLTVGKMEPYKPEDANRVRADGVIIKPFEASDLLAVIKKLEERIIPKTVAMAQDTVLLERPPEFADFETPLGNEAEASASSPAIQATVDVPDNMATTAAFSDMLGAEPDYSLDPLPVPKPASFPEAEVFVAPVVEPVESAAPVVDSGFSKTEEMAVEAWPPEPKLEPSVAAGVSPEPAIEAGLPVPVQEPTKSEQNGVGEWPTAAASTSAPSISISTPSGHEESTETFETAVEAGFAEPQRASHQELEVTAVSQESLVQPQEEKAVPAGNAAAAHEAQVSVADTQRFIDPGLAIDVVSFDQAPAQIETRAAAGAPSDIEFEVPQVEAEPAKASAEEEPKPAVSGQEEPASEDDFEARVAAAMSIYDAPAEERIEAEPSATEEVQPVPNENEAAAESAPAVSVEATPSFEYMPPVSAPSPIAAHEAAGRQFKESQLNREAMLITTEATMVIPVYLEPPVEPKQEEPPAAPQAQFAVPEEAVPSVEQSVEARIEAALPTVTAAAAAAAPAEVGADTQMITAVVDRILERLKPQMIEEIARELKAKK